jgi:(5-formylfuran-3-yl)methyl phosphate synthase
MTRMLASVTGPEEAEVALAGGADIIDLKDPARGALGAVDAATVRATVALAGERRPVSAVTGDLPMEPGTVADAVVAIAGTGVEFVKLGVFPGGDPAAVIRGLALIAKSVRLIAVLFADSAPDLGLLPALAEAGFAGAMLDTARKGADGGGRLLDHLPPPALRRFVAACREKGLLCGLAGALEPPDIPRLLLLQPDVLGFRGALCEGGRRDGSLDPARVALVRGLIPREAPAGGGVTQLHILGTRGFAPDPDDVSQTDRIFVHDLVLPVHIGAYAREHGAAQPVRFAVDAWVARPGRPVQDLRDVVSYDLIADGIRLLADSGHVELVETLAEQVAALLLAHRRVVRVRVRLEKLETGSGVVGVAIERTRDTMRVGAVSPFQFPAARP